MDPWEGDDKMKLGGRFVAWAIDMCVCMCLCAFVGVFFGGGEGCLRVTVCVREERDGVCVCVR